MVEGVRDGHRGVLATITGLTGTGARAVGTHMAVLDNGHNAGSFSSGCVEEAIVAEALAVLGEGFSRSIRFGEGSPYIDIRLPCGGGMDVLFQPDPRVDLIERALVCLGARQPIVLRLDRAAPLSVSCGGILAGTGWDNGAFCVHHVPPLRVILFGQGAEMLTMLRLCRSFGASVEIYSPDGQVVASGLAEKARSVRLLSAGSPLALEGDPWSAFLFLFHDHDWEPPLIARALDTTSFWVGAMGSTGTHKVRRAALAAEGVSNERIARVRGPVGLIPSSRDPATLALSALAEIVTAYRAVLP